MSECAYARRYSAGAVLQIMLFGIMAIQIKRKAPNCHTILEVVRLRWGKAAHLVSPCNMHASCSRVLHCTRMQC
jgi:Na+/proline symporter